MYGERAESTEYGCFAHLHGSSIDQPLYSVRSNATYPITMGSWCCHYQALSSPRPGLATSAGVTVQVPTAHSCRRLFPRGKHSVICCHVSQKIPLHRVFHRRIGSWPKYYDYPQGMRQSLHRTASSPPQASPLSPAAHCPYRRCRAETTHMYSVLSIN